MELDGFICRPCRKMTQTSNRSWRREDAYTSIDAGQRGPLSASGAARREQEQIDKREGALAASRLREEALYVADLIGVLQTHPGGRRRWAVMQAIRKHRAALGLPIPENFEQAVESAFHQHCPESGVFNKGKGPVKAALFHWPLGRVGGVWAVHAGAAQAWMADKK
jgi:hypothetical protein